MTSTSFTLSTPPSTDVWRKPPSTDVFNAPVTKTSTGSLKSFVSARITVALPKDDALIQYDQGGILLAMSDSSTKAGSGQWLKSGIEFYNSKPWVGTVGCDKWADWSIVPLDRRDAQGGAVVTLELERSKDELGKSLWLYIVPEASGGAQAERIPIREVNWIFAEDRDDVQLAVSAFAARPQKPPAGGPQELEVSFDHFEVNWK